MCGWAIVVIRSNIGVGSYLMCVCVCVIYIEREREREREYKKTYRLKRRIKCVGSGHTCDETRLREEKNVRKTQRRTLLKKKTYRSHSQHHETREDIPEDEPHHFETVHIHNDALQSLQHS